MPHMDIRAFAKKISLVMKALDKNQTEVAEAAEISRVSLNRFLRGQSELRLSDFICVMRVLGVDIEKVLRDRLSDVTGEKSKLKGLGADIELVLGSMSYLAKQSYIGHLVAYADLMGPLIPKTVYHRLLSEMTAE